MDLKINDCDILDAIFVDSNNNSLFNLNIILDIAQPMIYQLDYNDKNYLIYVLRDMSHVKNNELIRVQELLFSEVNPEDISKLIKSEMSIYDSFLKSNNIWRLGRIGNKVFPRKILENPNDIQDRFPIKNLKLKDLPNRAF